jgi:2-polyprenyl-3-methyl-5-hydroxy-6-metoxy-1,4-benzoquinol methylase
MPEVCADQSGTFDVVLSLKVVEHVANLPIFPDALARLVAPGAIVSIGTLKSHAALLRHSHHRRGIYPELASARPRLAQVHGAGRARLHPEALGLSNC